MVQAEGKIYDFLPESAIEADILETFPYVGERQLVRYETREFSAVCPFSGLPDFGRVLIEYIPAANIVELKSLKYYIGSYRQVGIYQEHATNRLFADLWRVIQPQYLKIETQYNTRGGIDTTCMIEKGTR